jgi:uncharacterized protein (TIGR03086 family)
MNHPERTEPDLIDLYAKASAWTAAKVHGADSKLDAPTPCDDWDVRTLLNHMLDTQNYFIHVAKGQKVAPPSADPPELIGDDPATSFERGRTTMLTVFGDPLVVEMTGPSLGIAFSDQLLHGWDLAMATAQDTTMPEGLPEVAYEMIHGRFTDDQRTGVFAPEITVADDASAQQRLLAYTGRDPQT